jgi:hypothetical protein
MSKRNSKIYDKVAKRFSKFPNVNVVKGIVPDNFEKACPEKISLLHIDMNSSKSETRRAGAPLRPCLAGWHHRVRRLRLARLRPTDVRGDSVDGAARPLDHGTADRPRPRAQTLTGHPRNMSASINGRFGASNGCAAEPLGR